MKEQKPNKHRAKTVSGTATAELSFPIGADDSNGVPTVVRAAAHPRGVVFCEIDSVLSFWFARSRRRSHLPNSAKARKSELGRCCHMEKEPNTGEISSPYGLFPRCIELRAGLPHVRDDSKGATLWLSPDGIAADPTEHQQSVKIPASQIHHDHSGIVQHGGEILLGSASGDMKTGRHGSFMFFPAGFVSLKHSHSHDYYAVVIKGTIANPLEGEKGLPLPPGSYWYQKGGEPHWTKCISKVPCTIFLVSDGSWDAQVLGKE
jgi:beta-alanine degradation protein BauB